MSQQLLYITSYLITIGISILFILFFTTSQEYFLSYALKWTAILLGKFIWFDKLDITKNHIIHILSNIVNVPILFFAGVTVLGALMGFIESNFPWIRSANNGFITGGFVAAGILGLSGFLLLVLPKAITEKYVKFLKLD